MTSASPLIFDRPLVRRHLNRAAPLLAEYDALRQDIAVELVERITSVKRAFTDVLSLGAPDGGVAKLLRNEKGCRALTAGLGNGAAVKADEEYLPFAAESFDLIVSNLSLHWVNDVPGALAQIHSVLKPGGMFLAALIGGASLHELRHCLMESEIAVTGGASPRLSPTIDLPNASMLMQRAGFALPVVDHETVALIYNDMFALMDELRGTGQTNAHIHRLRHFTRREVFFNAALRYRETYGDDQGRIPASFDIIYLHGWKDAP